ncbi:methyl-accepting chemotaxis protein [Clostridium sp. DSM 100503]|uniref:methyl-accepting chemotaxis protein n=1 Tax=Clostridium sp. DSM 100503 TaxID=2963282 RepID=UPI00214A2D7B|nr:methyl-accepting chemotaxis protein [Clostridium sp. DSM 100503]MCR1950406.1 methyl-accepting chemotaxis protein [Clostridium sp. DSM 100503]
MKNLKKSSKIKKPNKSIKTQIILLFSILLISSLLVLTAITTVSVNKKIKDDSLNMMSELTKRSASELNEYVNKYIMLSETLASTVSMSSYSDIQKNLISLNGYISQYSLDRILIADKSGNGLNSGGQTVNISDRDYFKTAMSGTSTVSSPLTDKTTGKTLMVYSAPIKNNGQIVGVLSFARDAKEISDKISTITFRSTGKTCLIDSNGTTIAHYEYKRVQEGENIIEIAKKNTSLAELAKSIEKMKSGETGFDEYDFNETRRVISYQNIPELNWSVGLMVDSSDLFMVVDTILKIVITVGIVSLIISMILAYRFSNKLSIRLKSVSSIVSNFAKGNFSQVLSNEELNKTDEIGEILSSIDKSQDSLKDMISSIKDSSHTLEEESLNLTNMSEDYLTSCKNIIAATKESSQGTYSQANQLSNITADMDIFDTNLTSIITSISNINTMVANINNKSTSSNEDIGELVLTMKSLENNFKIFSDTISSMKENINNITSITDVINSLSEQTNLLALNAAIEASRAGEAGKGFAVVADEIRKLAEESKTSSREITSIVQNVLNQTSVIVKENDSISSLFQTQIDETTKTMLSFDEIISLVLEVSKEINSLDKNSDSISKRKQNIIENITNSSAISEELSAATEEIYASSSELSTSSEKVAGSAEHLSTLTKSILDKLSKFKID